MLLRGFQVFPGELTPWVQDPAENRCCPSSLAGHAVTAGLLTTSCFLCRTKVTFGNKRTHCESSNPPFVGADSAVKLWDDLALPSSRESRGWSALLAARCPGRGSLLPTGCAGQVRAPSPAPALRDSGHQAPAKAGSVLPAGHQGQGGRNVSGGTASTGPDTRGPGKRQQMALVTCRRWNFCREV